MPPIRPDLTLTAQLGTAVTVTGTVTNKAGTPTTPATLTAQWAQPDGTEATPPTPSLGPATGAYEVTVTPVLPGRWHLFLRATDPNVSTVIAVDVPDPGVPAPY